MGKILTICLQKGGTSKTTTAQALAEELTVRNKKVLVVDLDGQANITYASGINKAEFTIVDVIEESATTNEVIQNLKYYDILPADDILYLLEREQLNSLTVKNILKPLKDTYDFIIIDSPPSLGNLFLNGLYAADHIIIPTTPDSFSLRGLNPLYQAFTQAKQLNTNLTVLGILLCRYHKRVNLDQVNKELLDETATAMNTTLFKHTIRDSVQIKEAQQVQKPLHDYCNKKCLPIFEDYKGFVTEVIERSKKNG